MNGSAPSPAPWGTWDYNRWKDPRYTNAMGEQISTATAIDAVRHRGLPIQAYHRFSTIQDRLILAPRAYAMQSAMLSAAESRAAILGRS